MLEVALFKQFFESWNRTRMHPARAALACVIGREIGCGVFDHLAASVGGALERRIVNHHQLTVLGQVQVEFAAAHAVLEALLEAGEGVFGCFAFGAAMAINQGHNCSLIHNSQRRDALTLLRLLRFVHGPDGVPGPVFARCNGPATDAVRR